MHIISSLISKIPIKYNYSFSSKKSDSSPPRHWKIWSPPQNPFSQDTLKSDFSQNRILISSQICRRKWHYEILQHVKNMLIFHVAMNLGSVFLNGRDGVILPLTKICPFLPPLWFSLPLNYFSPPTKCWLWRNDSFKFHLTVSLCLILQ